MSFTTPLTSIFCTFPTLLRFTAGALLVAGSACQSNDASPAADDVATASATAMPPAEVAEKDSSPEVAPSAPGAQAQKDEVDDEANKPSDAPAPEPVLAAGSPKAPAAKTDVATRSGSQTSKDSKEAAAKDAKETTTKDAKEAAPSSAPSPKTDATPVIEKPCLATSFKFGAVKSACAKGGVPSAKSLMKTWTNKAKEKGATYKCATCHDNQRTYTNKANADADLRKLLDLIK